VAPLETNAGTCWGKNTIDPSGRGIEKPRKATLTLTFSDGKQILPACLAHLFVYPEHQSQTVVTPLLNTIIN
jgi:hypothetical protein